MITDKPPNAFLLNILIGFSKKLVFKDQVKKFWGMNINKTYIYFMSQKPNSNQASNDLTPNGVIRL